MAAAGFPRCGVQMTKVLEPEVHGPAKNLLIQLILQKRTDQREGMQRSAHQSARGDVLHCSAGHHMSMDQHLQMIK